MTQSIAGPPQADEYCITVVRDEARPLGKRFLADGSKQATVALADGAMDAGAVPDGVRRHGSVARNLRI